MYIRIYSVTYVSSVMYDHCVEDAQTTKEGRRYENKHRTFPVLTEFPEVVKTKIYKVISDTIMLPPNLF